MNGDDDHHKTGWMTTDVTMEPIVMQKAILFII